MKIVKLCVINWLCKQFENMSEEKSGDISMGQSLLLGAGINMTPIYFSNVLNSKKRKIDQSKEEEECLMTESQMEEGGEANEAVSLIKL